MFTILLSIALSVTTPPVPGPVTQQFVAPACSKCAGHRGITIDNPDGHVVVSPVAGEITFAGTVAHRLYVVVQPRVGVLVTIGWLESMGVAKGDQVQSGQLVGIAGATTYLGVRRLGQYLEPLGFLGMGGARLVGGGSVREVVVGLGPLRR